ADPRRTLGRAGARGPRRDARALPRRGRGRRAAAAPRARADERRALLSARRQRREELLHALLRRRQTARPQHVQRAADARSAEVDADRVAEGPARLAQAQVHEAGVVAAPRELAGLDAREPARLAEAAFLHPVRIAELLAQRRL